MTPSLFLLLFSKYKSKPCQVLFGIPSIIKSNWHSLVRILAISFAACSHPRYKLLLLQAREWRYTEKTFCCKDHSRSRSATWSVHRSSCKTRGGFQQGKTLCQRKTRKNSFCPIQKLKWLGIQFILRSRSVLFTKPKELPWFSWDLLINWALVFVVPSLYVRGLSERRATLTGTSM